MVRDQYLSFASFPAPLFLIGHYLEKDKRISMLKVGKLATQDLPGLCLWVKIPIQMYAANIKSTYTL
jgi:hypothetical protein